MKKIFTIFMAFLAVFAVLMTASCSNDAKEPPATEDAGKPEDSGKPEDTGKPEDSGKPEGGGTGETEKEEEKLPEFRENGLRNIPVVKHEGTMDRAEAEAVMDAVAAFMKDRTHDGDYLTGEYTSDSRTLCSNGLFYGMTGNIKDGKGDTTTMTYRLGKDEMISHTVMKAGVTSFTVNGESIPPEEIASNETYLILSAKMDEAVEAQAFSGIQNLDIFTEGDASLWLLNESVFADTATDPQEIISYGKFTVGETVTEVEMKDREGVITELFINGKEVTEAVRAELDETKFKAFIDAVKIPSGH